MTWPFENDTSAVEKKLASRSIKADKRRSVFVILTIALAVCLMRLKAFTEKDFLRFHPGGSLGQRLRLDVREVMRTEELPFLPQDAVQVQALASLDRGGLGALVLVDEQGHVSGILTDGDVRRAVCRDLLRPEEPVSAIMTRSPRCGRLGDTVAQLLDLMEQKAITVLPVVDEDNRLLGVVHMHDLLGKGSISIAGR